MLRQIKIKISRQIKIKISTGLAPVDNPHSVIILE